MFSIEIAREQAEPDSAFKYQRQPAHDQVGADVSLAPEILIIEDDPEMADLLSVVVAEGAIAQ